MKRSLKRSRLVGMLAVLLTMSLVTAFGTPAAVADPDRSKQSADAKDHNDRCKDAGQQTGHPQDRSECDNGNGGRQTEQSNDEASAGNSEDGSSHRNSNSSSNSDGSSDSKSKSKSNSAANSNGNSNRDETGSAESKRNSKSNSQDKGTSSSDSQENGKSSSNSNSSSKNRSKSKSQTKGSGDSARNSQSNSNRTAAGSANSKSNSRAKGSDEGSKTKSSNRDSQRRSKDKGTRGGPGGNRSDTHPPGNNGTVKIDGLPFGDHPNNEPHPGCTFQVDFYNYEDGDLSASVTFTAHPPTNPSGEVVLSDSGIWIGEDPAMGGTDLDATRTYTLDLSGHEPHDRQGHHIKLTVNAEGSIGADTKHKVFWVDCLESAAPDDDVDDNVIEDDDSGNTIDDDDVDADRDEDEVAADEEERDRVEVETAEDSVLGTIIQRGSPRGPTVVQGTTEVAGQQEAQQETRGAAVLPFTGAGLTALVVMALALVGTGIAALATRRRSEI